MNKKLEFKKVESEYMRVMAARHEMEYRVEERLDEIKRLEDNIVIQKQKEIELKIKMKEIGE